MTERGFISLWRSAENDFESSWRSAQQGFTLIEMLVALAVFSLAAMALLRLQGVSLRTTADLDQRVVAQAVARNIAVETLTDPAPPAIGNTGGTAVNGGRPSAWTRRVQALGGGALRIDIAVRSSTGAPVILTIARRAR
ncbi:MAG TPA: type II secretion system minor pseudopilin GspI [Sphingomonas sp.]|nr:type II secretion system minor pseudopilin GspI [Sphingomonas sp.]